jgi:hypothetical protein
MSLGIPEVPSRFNSAVALREHRGLFHLDCLGSFASDASTDARIVLQTLSTAFPDQRPSRRSNDNAWHLHNDGSDALA